MMNNSSDKTFRRYVWTLSIITFASLIFCCAGSSGPDLMFKLSDYSHSPLLFMMHDSSELIDIISSLAFAVKDENEKALKKFVKKNKFLPAGMTKEEYVERVFKSGKRIVIEDDSLRIVFLDETKHIMTIDAVASREDIDRQDISSREKGNRHQAFQLSVVESDPSWAGRPAPTNAIVHVSMLLQIRKVGDSVSTSNSIFFGKEGKNWVITSFEKDLLQLAEARTDFGKE